MNILQKDNFEIDFETIANLSYQYIKNDSTHFKEKKTDNLSRLDKIFRQSV